MTNYGDYYHCEICGHVVSIFNPGNPSLVCCGQMMGKLEAKTKDEGKEKHVPVIEADGDTTTIKLGSVPHPMTEEHFIVFIEVLTKDGIYTRAKLKAGDEPKAKFNINAKDIDTVYAYCNVHGLWKA